MNLSFLRKHSFKVLAVAFIFVLFAHGAFAQQGESRKIRSKVNPVYPELARKLNVRGIVKIEVVVAPSGNVRDTRVIGGHPLLVGAAEDALKRWKYEPASDETKTIIEINFTPGM